MNFNKDFSDYNTLMKSLQERDISAFDYVYHTLRKRLFALALYIVEDEENAKDLVQDIFADFWEKRLYLQITSTIEYYLLRAVKNKAVNYKKKQVAISSITNNLPGPALENGYSSLDNRELGKKLETAIKKLPPTSSKVFQLHYIERLSYEEISQELGITKSTISTHMDRALKKLRSLLKKDQ